MTFVNNPGCLVAIYCTSCRPQTPSAAPPGARASGSASLGAGDIALPTAGTCNPSQGQLWGRDGAGKGEHPGQKRGSSPNPLSYQQLGDNPWFFQTAEFIVLKSCLVQHTPVQSRIEKCCDTIPVTRSSYSITCCPRRRPSPGTAGYSDSPLHSRRLYETLHEIKLLYGTKLVVPSV